nr:MAG TPA: hypothetical protein [Caudoviricetes sp.]
MKCVYIGKNKPLFGTIGEMMTDTFGNRRFVALDGIAYYLDERDMVKADYFIEMCNIWLHKSILMWESKNSPFCTNPSIFEKVEFDENFDEAMFWTKDDTWSRAIDFKGATWVICNKTKTSMYAQRLDQFLRESFHENPQDLDDE